MSVDINTREARLNQAAMADLRAAQAKRDAERAAGTRIEMTPDDGGAAIAEKETDSVKGYYKDLETTALTRFETGRKQPAHERYKFLGTEAVEPATSVPAAQAVLARSPAVKEPPAGPTDKSPTHGLNKNARLFASHTPRLLRQGDVKSDPTREDGAAKDLASRRLARRAAQDEKSSAALAAQQAQLEAVTVTVNPAKQNSSEHIQFDAATEEPVRMDSKTKYYDFGNEPLEVSGTVPEAPVRVAQLTKQPD